MDTLLCRIDELPDGGARGFDPGRSGQDTLLLVRRGTQVFAYADACPHHGTPMAWRKDGYELAKKEFGAVEVDGGPWCKLPNGIIIKDVIADAFLQQILTRPAEYDVIATPNLNGDYISDALAAQVGGIGIAPGGNINYESGFAVFEATHGTAPKYANLDKVNPGSVILSGEMMFRYMGWTEAADIIMTSLEKTIGNKTVTYDLARMIPGSKELKCSEFGDAMIANM